VNCKGAARMEGEKKKEGKRQKTYTVFGELERVTWKEGTVKGIS